MYSLSFQNENNWISIYVDARCLHNGKVPLFLFYKNWTIKIKRNRNLTKFRRIWFTLISNVSKVIESRRKQKNLDKTSHVQMVNRSRSLEFGTLHKFLKSKTNTRIKLLFHPFFYRVFYLIYFILFSRFHCFSIWKTTSFSALSF